MNMDNDLKSNADASVRAGEEQLKLIATMLEELLKEKKKDVTITRKAPSKKLEQDSQENQIEKESEATQSITEPEASLAATTEEEENLDRLEQFDSNDLQAEIAPEPATPDHRQSNGSAVDLYRQNPAAFEAKYQPISVSETEESIQCRWSSESQELTVGEDRRGNYWLFQEDGVDRLVPNPSLKVNDMNIRTASGLFELENYKHDYKSLEAIQPAKLITQGNGQWKLEQKGVIDFNPQQKTVSQTKETPRQEATITPVIEEPIEKNPKPQPKAAGEERASVAQSADLAPKPKRETPEGEEQALESRKPQQAVAKDRPKRDAEVLYGFSGSEFIQNLSQQDAVAVLALMEGREGQKVPHGENLLIECDGKVLFETDGQGIITTNIYERDPRLNNDHKRQDLLGLSDLGAYATRQAKNGTGTKIVNKPDKPVDRLEKATEGRPTFTHDSPQGQAFDRAQAQPALGATMYREVLAPLYAELPAERERITVDEHKFDRKPLRKSGPGNYALFVTPQGEKKPVRLGAVDPSGNFVASKEFQELPLLR